MVTVNAPLFALIAATTAAAAAAAKGAEAPRLGGPSPQEASSQQVSVQAARQASPQYGESPEGCQGQVSQLEEGLQGGCAEEGRNVKAVM